MRAVFQNARVTFRDPRGEIAPTAPQAIVNQTANTVTLMKAYPLRRRGDDVAVR